MTFWKGFHMPNGNIWNLFKMLFSFLYVIMMFPKWANCDQDVLKTNQCDQNVLKTNQCDQNVLKTNQCDQNVPTNHMVKTFSECHWGNFKWLLAVTGNQMWCTCWCYIPNVAPIGSRSNTWSGNIWNVPNLLLAGKWWVPSTRAYNVLKMFLLVSRPPRPQCLQARNEDLVTIANCDNDRLSSPVS